MRVDAHATQYQGAIQCDAVSGTGCAHTLNCTITNINTDMPQGTVKWFSVEKGFGFIAPHDGTKDIFVHHSNIADKEARGPLQDEDEVEFDVEETPKGLNALGVERL